MPRKKNPGTSSANETRAAVASLRYPAKRKNIPLAGIEAHGVVRETPTVRYAFNPHLPPVRRSSPDPATTDQLPELLTAARQRALTDEEATVLADALRRHEPWLEWSGKLACALGNAGAVDPAAFDALSGFRSLPFLRPARLGDGALWMVAVKVIDPRGNEGPRMLTEGGRWA